MFSFYLLLTRIKQREKNYIELGLYNYNNKELKMFVKITFGIKRFGESNQQKMIMSRKRKLLVEDIEVKDNS